MGQPKKISFADTEKKPKRRQISPRPYELERRETKKISKNNKQKI